MRWVKDEVCERMVRMVWMSGTVGRGQDVAIVVGWSDRSARAGIALLTISTEIYSFVHYCASLSPFVVRWSHGKAGADRILLTKHITQKFSWIFFSHWRHQCIGRQAGIWGRVCALWESEKGYLYFGTSTILVCTRVLDNCADVELQNRDPNNCPADREWKEESFRHPTVTIVVWSWLIADRADRWQTAIAELWPEDGEWYQPGEEMLNWCQC